MNKNYLFLTVLALLIGFGILLMPEKKTDKQLNPQLLLNAIDDPSRFLSSDVITDRLVKKDPSMILIDVRQPNQFKTFAIPGAINIPLDSILTESATTILGNKDIDKVFYSNAELQADQAWILCKRTGYHSIYVLKGGVNYWFKTIVKTELPAESEPIEVMDLYQFRRAACQYFFGSKETGVKTEILTETKKTVTTTKKAATSGGGC